MPSLNEHDAAVTPFAQNPITRVVKFLISATYYVGREVLSAVSRLLGMRKPGLAVAITRDPPGPSRCVSMFGCLAFDSESAGPFN